MPDVPPRPRKTSWTLKEISETDFGEPEWLIPEILPQGFFFVAGKPKLGKSFLCLQLAIAKASGTEFLNRTLEPGRVLYLALEDNPRRIKKRTRFLKFNSTTNLEIEETWKPLNQGGTEDLVKRLRSKKYALCIIDPFNRAFRLKDIRDVTETTRALEPLHNLTRDGYFSQGFVDHHHKSGQYSGDPIEDIHGSIAKGGVADTVWSLQRERGQETAKILIASRDTEVSELEICFERHTMTWRSKEKPEVLPGSNQAKILEYMQSSEEHNWIREIAKALSMNPGAVAKEVNELIAKGKIRKGEPNGNKAFPLFLIQEEEE